MKAWEDFLRRQEELLGKPIIEKWLRPLRVAHFDSANLYLEASDSFLVIWFEEHIRPILKKQLLNNNFRPIKVHLTVAQESSPVNPINLKGKEKKPTPQRLTLSPDPLIPTAIMERFIAGPSNSVVFQFFCELTGFNSATQTYTTPTLPLGSFNPIYLWGGAGTGKTHLLMALAHAFKQRGLVPLYTRVETFTEHVVSAIRASEMQTFRNAYRHVDVLLMDDVHLFSRKMATQEEFFHTFNALHMVGKQIILTANCPPAQLKEIEPRLVSRFEWGINLHFEKVHSLELAAILKEKCDAFHFSLSSEAQEFLLKKFSSNASLTRALEALVLRCHLDENRQQSDHLQPASIERMIADLIAQESSTALNEEKILLNVCSHFEVEMEQLLGKSQIQEHSFPRQIAMFLCRNELKMPFAKIGRLFGRDHSTVMTSTKQIQKGMEEGIHEIRSHLAEITKKITGF